MNDMVARVRQKAAGTRRSTLVALVGTGAMIAGLGVVGFKDLQAHECWANYALVSGSNRNQFFPPPIDAAKLREGKPGSRRDALAQPIVQQALDHEGDSTIGEAVWLSLGSPRGPELENGQGVLLAHAAVDPDAVGGYTSVNGKLLWDRVVTVPTTFTFKDSRAVAVSAAKDHLQVSGFAAFSGQLQWCRALPLIAVPGKGPFVTKQAGDGRQVLILGRRPGRPADSPVSTVTSLDVMTGQVLWQQDVPGDWREIAAGAGHAALLGRTPARNGEDGAKSGYALTAMSLTDGLRLWTKDALPYAEQPGADAPGVARLIGVESDRILLTEAAVAERPAPAVDTASYEATGEGDPALQPASVVAYDLQGRHVWTQAASPRNPADELQVAAGRVVVPQVRGGEKGFAAFEAGSGELAWFVPFAQMPVLSRGDNDGTMLYLPSNTGPIVLALADGTRMPTGLEIAADRLIVSGSRLVCRRALPQPEPPRRAIPDFTVAFVIPRLEGTVTELPEPLFPGVA